MEIKTKHNEDGSTTYYTDPLWMYFNGLAFQASLSCIVDQDGNKTFKTYCKRLKKSRGFIRDLIHNGIHRRMKVFGEEVDRMTGGEE